MYWQEEHHQEIHPVLSKEKNKVSKSYIQIPPIHNSDLPSNRDENHDSQTTLKAKGSYLPKLTTPRRAD